MGTDRGAPAEGRVAREASRRRTFAIISHPDAGKTTLTEKLLLYGGAIHLAGSIRARRAARHATSDWMALEQERGISVTSSVLQFEYGDRRINLLDTPGHQDFSEDTYRTLMAADSAVMLLDNRRGVEEQTRKLFTVCRRRRLPIFTFVNKCDRAGTDPLGLLDAVEEELGIRCYAANWPIFREGGFVGVYDRSDGVAHLFRREGHHGQQKAETEEAALGSPRLDEVLGEEVHRHLREEVELLEEVGASYSEGEVLAGELTPVFFGSALTNFGVEPFLRAFLRLAPPPAPRETTEGPVRPDDPAFSGFVFKVQANMDPRHRDRLAFVRVCSGRFRAGMQATRARGGEAVRLAAPQQFMARERQAVEEAWPGDVVGIHDRGSLRVGDSLGENGVREYGGIPRFSPEHFARVRVEDPLRRKHLDRGLRQLSEEGAAQVFYAEDLAGPAPIVGAVGQLQFDVLVHRLRHEYGVEAVLEPMGFRYARWVEGEAGKIEQVADGFGRGMVRDAAGQPLILFDTEWNLRTTVERESGLTFHEVEP